MLLILPLELVPSASSTDHDIICDMRKKILRLAAVYQYWPKTPFGRGPMGTLPDC